MNGSLATCETVDQLIQTTFRGTLCNDPAPPPCTLLRRSQGLVCNFAYVNAQAVNEILLLRSIYVYSNRLI